MSLSRLGERCCDCPQWEVWQSYQSGVTDMQFGVGSVPITVAAKVYGHRESWVRAGIVGGWLPIGTATRDGKLVTRVEEMEMGGRIAYYISPKLLYEHTGYIWKGGEEI